MKKSFPFAQTFKSKLKGPLTLRTIQNNLGKTFHPRLIQIYNNIMEAIILNKNDYLKTSTIPSLTSEIDSQRTYLRSLGQKLKLHQPRRKMIPLKNYLFGESIFRNQNFYITVMCKVYFGGVLDHSGDYGFKSNQKLIRFGRHRYFVYNTSLSFKQNIQSIKLNQLFEFTVKYESNLYIEVKDTHNSDIYGEQKASIKFDQDIGQDSITTEIKMQSSSQKFDWIIVDINGIMKQKTIKK